MFHANEVPYEMRWNKIIQPKIKPTIHGLRSLSHLVAKLWNDFFNESQDICDLKLNAVKDEKPH